MFSTVLSLYLSVIPQSSLSISQGITMGMRGAGVLNMPLKTAGLPDKWKTANVLHINAQRNILEVLKNITKVMEQIYMRLKMNSQVLGHNRLQF